MVTSARYSNRHSVVIFILLALYVLLFVPIWQPVILGLLFASACAPPLRKMQAMLKSRRSPLAYATVAVSILVFLLVFVYLGFKTYTFLFKLSENPDNLGNIGEQIQGVKQKLVTWLGNLGFLSVEEISQHLDRLVTQATQTGRELLVNASKAIFTRTPEVIFSLVIFFMAFIAFLLGGTRVAMLLGKKFDWDVKTAQTKFENACALSLGSVILTSLMQATVVVIGCAIVGIPSLFLVFLVTFIVSMIPVLGAASVPAVLALVQFFNGETGSGIVLVVTALIAGTADNVLKAYLFSRAAKTNPLISLMALLGGIALFGFPGLFIAPVVEQLLMSSLEDKTV